MAASGMIARGFGLDTAGTEVLFALSQIGAAVFIVSRALFVAGLAFNALGKPLRSTAINWFCDGLLTLTARLWLTGFHGATGVIYTHALVGILVALLSWRYVAQIGTTKHPQLDLTKRRAYRNINTYWRR